MWNKIINLFVVSKRCSCRIEVPECWGSTSRQTLVVSRSPRGPPTSISAKSLPSEGYFLEAFKKSTRALHWAVGSAALVAGGLREAAAQHHNTRRALRIPGHVPCAQLENILKYLGHVGQTIHMMNNGT